MVSEIIQNIPQNLYNFRVLKLQRHVNMNLSDPSEEWQPLSIFYFHEVIALDKGSF